MKTALLSRRLVSSLGRRHNGTLVLTHIENNIGIITLNDPKRLNALTEQMGLQFVDAVNAMNEAALQQKIRACIVTGSGDAFSAGGDLYWLRQRHDSSAYANRNTMIRFYNLFLHVRTLTVPTIAAINGHAIGAGMCMTLGCDFRIASESARIGFTFVKLGIHPGMGASILLPRLISTQRAFEYLMSGSVVSGTEAQQHGLVLEALPTGDVLSRAKGMAQTISGNAPIAVQTLTQSLRADKFVGLDDGLLREADAQATAYSSKDFLLGLEATKIRKTPQFHGWE